VPGSFSQGLGARMPPSRASRGTRGKRQHFPSRIRPPKARLGHKECERHPAVAEDVRAVGDKVAAMVQMGCVRSRRCAAPRCRFR
jgi:hypothetical protein